MEGFVTSENLMFWFSKCYCALPAVSSGGGLGAESSSLWPRRAVYSGALRPGVPKLTAIQG